MKEIVIVGGGASGLMAAIAAKTGDTNVTVLERGARVGRKLLATGNGRCNLTNIYACPSRYHGGDVSFIDYAVGHFWVDETLSFFRSLGVITKTEEDGKVYPYSDSASAVLDVLRRTAAAAGVFTECGCGAVTVRKKGGGFDITDAKGGARRADAVVIACGGKAAPDLGGTDSGYGLLKSFGHGITPLAPSLVQIKTDTDIVKKLKGIKTRARISTGKDEATGELLFTDYGLSGPPVFSISSRLDGCGELSVDLMPEYGYPEVLSMLEERAKLLSSFTLEEYFTGMLNKRVGMALLKSVGIEPLSRKAGSLTQRELRAAAGAVKGWRFCVRGTMSWRNAQVTRGGAVTSEFCPDTMGSRKVPSLYACGEVLDIDGDCGGFNLQWAWSSGRIAGRSAAGAPV